MTDPRLYEPEPWRRAEPPLMRIQDLICFWVFVALWFGLCLWGVVTQPSVEPQPAVIIRIEGYHR